MRWKRWSRNSRPFGQLWRWILSWARRRLFIRREIQIRGSKDLAFVFKPTCEVLVALDGWNPRRSGAVDITPYNATKEGVSFDVFGVVREDEVRCPSTQAWDSGASTPIADVIVSVAATRQTVLFAAEEITDEIDGSVRHSW